MRNWYLLGETFSDPEGQIRFFFEKLAGRTRIRRFIRGVVTASRDFLSWDDKRIELPPERR